MRLAFEVEEVEVKPLREAESVLDVVDQFLDARGCDELGEQRFEELAQELALRIPPLC